MSYLLDTNVLSELVRVRPHAGVVRWVGSQPAAALHLSVLTLGEIRSGMERVTDRRRREKLRAWLEEDLPSWFEGRLLAIGAEVADRWGRLRSEVKTPVPAVDSLLAATALHHDLRLVTRNTADFRYPGLELVNPWS
ncbi:MAG TPA: type II toxin-antitoxin system VapC family toxin [Candidatus Polarisedimenticolaceae bacterium]|nr:type II toxin-antitoxin system VapC family toxin [Candidatus Polarisedimenticolaceae bacterium]